METFNEVDPITKISIDMKSINRAIQYCDLNEGAYFLNIDSRNVVSLCKKIDEDVAAVIYDRNFENKNIGNLMDKFDEIVPIKGCRFYPFKGFEYLGCNRGENMELPWRLKYACYLNPGEFFIYNQSLYMKLNTPDEANCLELYHTPDSVTYNKVLYTFGFDITVLTLKSVSIEVQY